MIRDCLILAGGLGTRLKTVVSDVPKPMADIDGKPFLEYILRYLKEWNIKRCIIAVGYKKEKLISYFGNTFFNMNIEYAIEEEPLGTGGAIWNALHLLNDEFLLLNGDSLFIIDLYMMYMFFKNVNADVLIALKKVNQSDRYGFVNITKDGRITKFFEKESIIESDEYYINGGVYIIKKNSLIELPFKKSFSWEKDFLELYTKRMKIYGFISNSYFIDIGIPEDYNRAKHELPKLFG